MHVGKPQGDLPPDILKDFLRLEQGNLNGVSARRQKLFLARHGWELAIDGHGKYNYYFPPTDTTASNRRDAIRVTLDQKNGDEKMTAAGGRYGGTGGVPANLW